MKIITHTDNNIEGREALSNHVENKVRSAINHFEHQITRVEVFLSDRNSHKGGADDIRCVIEARIEGHQPVAVTHDAENMHQAINGASERLKSSLSHTLGKLAHR